MKLFLKRALATVIDNGLFLLVWSGLAYLSNNSIQPAKFLAMFNFFPYGGRSYVVAGYVCRPLINLGLNSAWPLVVFVIFFIGYYLLLEGIWGKTLGKKVMGLKVVAENGQGAGFWKILVRNLFRLLDAAPFWYLLGAIAYWICPTRQRIGDHLGQTLVVEENRNK